MNSRFSQIENIDDKDILILEAIENDARLTYQEIGERVGLSRVAVKNRMDAMKEKGIIKGFVTEINGMAAPEGILFFLDAETLPDYYDDVCEYLAGSGIIRQIYGVAGNCRIHAVGYASNSKTLDAFGNHLYRSKRGVQKLEICPMISTIMDVDGGIEYVRYNENQYLEGPAGEGRETDGSGE